MQAFAFSGRTRAGESINGERQAESLEAAVASLRREQILITRIDPVKSKASRGLPKPGGKVPAKSLAIFTRQFSVMIDAGLPLVQCLDILGRQEPHKKFAATILKVREDVESGMSLAEAMRKHPRTFDALFTNMIQAGEAGGILDTILKRLATYIEKNVKLISQVKSAMIYPVAVIIIAAVVVAVILWKVIPTFAQMFAGLGRAAAAADPHRHRDEQRPGDLRAAPHHGAGGDRLRDPDVLPHQSGAARHRRPAAEGADPRDDPAQGRGGPLLPHALAR